MADQGAAFTENLNRLHRFFAREGETGYSFAVAPDERLIPEINQSLQSKARQNARTISLLDLAPPQAEGLIQRLRSAAEGADGLIVTGLSTWLNADPTHLQALNFSRESLQSLGLPLLFWINETHLRSLSRQATDLYTQRRMATLFFERPLDLLAIEQRLQTRFDDTYKSSQDYERLQYRLALLQAQYQEAQQQAHPRLLRDYLLPLAEAYAELDVHQEALQLLRPWLTELMQLKEPEELILLGDILYGAKQYAEAEQSYLTAKPLIPPQSSSRLSYLLVQLGDLKKEVGQLPQAEAYYQEVLTLDQARLAAAPQDEGVKNRVAIALSRLGGVCQAQGKFEQALAFFQKETDLFEELCQANPHAESLKNGLAISYEKLGGIFQAQGKFEQALAFFQKDNELREELFQANPHSYQLINGLAISYYKLGDVYRATQQLEQARPYFEQAQGIWQQLHAQTGIPQLAGYLETVEEDLAGCDTDGNSAPG